MRKRFMPLVVLLILVTLTACDDGVASPPAPAPSGNAANGKVIFNEPVIANGPGCATCHSIEPGKVIVGPALNRIGTLAPEVIQRPGYKGMAENAADYLRESIVNPDAYVEDGFSPGVMPKNYTDMPEQEVDDLVAYLLTLK